MGKNWVIKPRAAVEPLAPDYARDLHDPFLLKDMVKAVARIRAALAANEKIIIFGDYDADGVPGAAVVAEFFRQIKFTNFEVYLPDRHEEAFGLNIVAVEDFAHRGATLIITVDCGTANVAEVARAKELGVEVVITDHHLADNQLPDAAAIINPKQPGDEYPYKMLCGAGVAFKLAQALSSNEDWTKWLLDLVGIATISDMVPLDGENRALAFYGLKVLRQTRRVGLQALFRRLNLCAEFLTEDDIAFMISPRINTASRMSHARWAYDLLTTTDQAVAEEIVAHLEEKNAARKILVEEIMADLAKRVEAAEMPPLIVMGHESWSLGVLGLTATRVVEKYERSVFLWGKNKKGEIKGSCRSDGTVNVVDLMEAAGGEKLFSNFGGHLHAGGFSLTAELAAAGDLSARLEECLTAAHAQLPPLVGEPEIIIERELELAAVDESFYKQLEKRAPFGVGNPKLNFLFRNLKLTGAKTFGAAGSHLELSFSLDGKKETAGKGKIIRAIAFFNPFTNFKFFTGQHLDLVATIEKSYFRNRPELRLRIVDLRVAA